MAKNNSRILKWFVWLQNFDFEIIYKPGYLNCLADMLSREQVFSGNNVEHSPLLGIFSVGSSSKTSQS